jgi:hypothetical protein
VAAGELSDEQAGGAGVDGEEAVDGGRAHRSRRAMRRGVIAVGRPRAGVVDQDLDRAEGFLGPVKEGCRGGGVGKVRLQRHGAASSGTDALQKQIAALSPQAPVVLCGAGLGQGVEAQEGGKDRGTRGGEAEGGGGTDAVIGPRDQRDPAGQSGIGEGGPSHGGRVCAPRPPVRQ